MPEDVSKEMKSPLTLAITADSPDGAAISAQEQDVDTSAQYQIVASVATPTTFVEETETWISFLEVGFATVTHVGEAWVMSAVCLIALVSTSRPSTRVPLMAAWLSLRDGSVFRTQEHELPTVAHRYTAPGGRMATALAPSMV